MESCGREGENAGGLSNLASNIT